MTFFDELGLRAAEQLEASVGAYVALASYKRLVAAEPPIRGRAAFGALRCAVELGDEAEIASATASWAEERSVDVDATPLVVRLLQSRRTRLASDLGHAELTRRPTARAAYVVARAVEFSNPSVALVAWDRAVAIASEKRDEPVLAASVARWLELVLFATDPPPLVLGVRQSISDKAALASIEAATPAQRLVIARARLLSASKFQRASALSALVELARTGADAIARHAVVACARHADAMGAKLEPIEEDRVRTALKLWPDESARTAALQRLEAAVAIETAARLGGISSSGLDDLIERVVRDAPEIGPPSQRVRALARGGSGTGNEGREHEGASLDLRLATLGIDAVAAMSRGAFGDAKTALVRAKEALPPIAAVPPGLYGACTLALSKRDAGMKQAASAFLSRAMTRSFGAPNGGFAKMGVALARGGFYVEAREVLAEAARLREPGAALLLAEIERKLAYEALRRGDRATALEGLRRARNLFQDSATNGSR